MLNKNAKFLAIMFEDSNGNSSSSSAENPGTSQEKSQDKVDKAEKEMKQLQEWIRMLSIQAEQLPTDSGAAKFLEMATILWGGAARNMAEAKNLGKAAGLMGVFGSAKEVLQNLHRFEEGGNGNNNNSNNPVFDAEGEEQMRNIESAFQNVSEQMPDCHLKVFADGCAGMVKGMVDGSKLDSNLGGKNAIPVVTMLNAAHESLSRFSKYPHLMKEKTGKKSKVTTSKNLTLRNMFETLTKSNGGQESKLEEMLKVGTNVLFNLYESGAIVNNNMATGKDATVMNCSLSNNASESQNQKIIVKEAIVNYKESKLATLPVEEDSDENDLD